MARGVRPPKTTMAPWPPASAHWSRGRGPTTGASKLTGEGEESGADGEEADGVTGKGGGVTHRVQGPGEEESDASRERLGEST